MPLLHRLLFVAASALFVIGAGLAIAQPGDLAGNDQTAAPASTAPTTSVPASTAPDTTVPASTVPDTTAPAATAAPSSTSSTSTTSATPSTDGEVQGASVGSGAGAGGVGAPVDTAGGLAATGGGDQFLLAGAGVAALGLALRRRSASAAA